MFVKAFPLPAEGPSFLPIAIRSENRRSRAVALTVIRNQRDENRFRACRAAFVPVGAGGQGIDVLPELPDIDPRRKARTDPTFEQICLKLSISIKQRSSVKAAYTSIQQYTRPSLAVLFRLFMPDGIFYWPLPDGGDMLSAVIRSPIPVSENRRSDAPTVAGSCADAFPMSPQVAGQQVLLTLGQN